MTFNDWWEGVPCDPEDTPDERSYTRRIAEAAWNAALENQWQPIESAPKDGTKIDLWAKCWTSHNDKWMYQRFPNCYWCDHKFIDNAKPEWVNLNKEWFPTHWMPIPAAPKGE